MNDYDFVRRVLWDNLPELRDAIVSVEDEQREFEEAYAEGVVFGVSIYSLASDVFIVGALAPLLAGEDLEDELAFKCSKVIESLLSGGGEEVRQMVSIRITDYILGWNHWLRFKKYAGPALIEEVERRRRYYVISG